MSDAATGMELRTLLHSGGVGIALACLKSLQRALPGVTLRHCIHDDGSLTRDDCDRLAETLGTVSIVTRAEADDRMAPVLARRPHSAAYRRAYPWGLKLLDILHLAEGPVRYIDGDVLFLRTVGRLFPEDTTRACVLHEPSQTCQSASLRALVWRHGLVQPDRINAGMFYLPASGADLDFIEWFLSKPELNGLPNYSEQTCLAVLAAKHAPLRWKPSQAICRFGPLEIAPEWHCIHFIGEQKRVFPELHRTVSEPMPAGALEFETSPLLSRGTLLASRVRRLLKGGR